MTTEVSQDYYRVCDLCGGVDSHPRHVVAGVLVDDHPVNEALRATVEKNIAELVNAGTIDIKAAFRIEREFSDTTSQDRHIDCCAEAGCPKAGTVDGCDQRVAVWNGETGAGMKAAADKVREDNPEHYAVQEG